MAKEKITGADYLLVLLYLNNEKPIVSSIRLTKMMFLFTEEIFKKLNGEIQITMLPEFIPYNFGPFSKSIYEQVQLFKSLEFISVMSNAPIEVMEAFDNIEESEFLKKRMVTLKLTI